MTQNERVLDYLRKHGAITPKEAMNELGIMRLGARIYDLKKQGVSITRENVTEKNRFNEPTTFARYKLEDVNAQ